MIANSADGGELRGDDGDDEVDLLDGESDCSGSTKCVFDVVCRLLENAVVAGEPLQQTELFLRHWHRLVHFPHRHTASCRPGGCLNGRDLRNGY